MKLKAAIRDPYLDTLGGGERYCLTVAEILLKHNYQVDLFWSKDPSFVQKAQQRFNLKLDQLKLVKNPSNMFEKYQLTKNYDLIFYLSDGSVPFLFAKKNFLHVQVPFTKAHSPFSQIVNVVKLKNITAIICNSAFTQSFTKKHLHTKKTTVLYPPVDVSQFKPALNKKNIILAVGRFDNILNTKRQDVLIDAFKILAPNNIAWRLVLAGGSLQKPAKNTYLKNLKNQAYQLPIDFVINPNFDHLKKLYATAKIFWHAAGFGVDQHRQPHKTEHFGITTVEAMAAGLVPLVVKKGGLTEIVDHGHNGYHWQTIQELAGKTQLLISDPKILNKISQQAKKDANKFSKANFEIDFIKLIQKP